jgi:hypothetical protein
MKAKSPLTLAIFGCLCLFVIHTVSAQESPNQDRQRTIGHFTVSIPQGWNSFSDSDKAEARREFSSDLAPSLKQYEKRGAPQAHMDEFAIYQKPTDGQLIGWTLVIPDQTDFLTKILKREDIQFEKGKSLSGGRVKGGSCRLEKVGTVDVVRVDVEMANGGKTTNLHFWSPKTPGIVTTLMIGVRPNKSDQTEKDYEKILSSLAVSEEIKK